MTVQIVTDTKGNKVAAIVPWKRYRKMMEDLEELEDIRLYDEAKQQKSEPIPADKAFKMVEAKRKKK
jgi:hypothetical protein